MRFLRVLIGLMLILAAGFIIVGEQLSGASSGAVVNARLTTLQSPIAGEISMSNLALGSLVGEGEQIARISDPLVDDIRLADLRLERNLAQAERGQITDQIAAIDDSLEILTNRARQYGRERIRQLEAEIEAARSNAAAAEARLEQAQGTLDRVVQLSERGVATEAAFDAATADARVAERLLEQNRSQLRVLEIQLEAARDGIFLGDSYNDAPYSEQRAEELQLRRRELEADLDAVSARLSAITERINAEQRRVNLLSEAVVVANVSGRLWEVLAADGERVQRGEDIMRLVDCNSTFVTLSVAESVYNRLQIGDPAQFRPNGESIVYEGTVSRLAGSGAATVYSNLAVAPSGEHLERYDVTLLVPDLALDPALGCAIGRTGRAFFQSRPLDWARGLLSRLSP
ncbi:HlyD family secretion protein [Amorphus orientalis]|uniref:Multidrug resistance efflux pump n=1 Tax=Amorphus orientalis TaxID=649198 RepID=A0AAE3VM32_9HYPH|nr:HlyD family efflux transporter periplasmic adaptor subunit [Amorphus orientalis]MDQ0314558.1 multidrug resistance efflux pump [Amorphus orientalis]